MKAFITWLLMFLTMLFNDVDFTPQDNIVPYDESKIFKLDIDSEKQYTRDTIKMGTASAQYTCRTGKYDGYYSLIEYVDAQGDSVPHTYTACWWEIDSDENPVPKLYEISSSTNQYLCKSGGYIVAPCDCKLITNSASSDGTSMEILTTAVGQPTYKINIDNMKCWYCDVSRGIDGELRHTYTLATQEFKRGQVLGVAIQDNTTITVTLMDGTKVSSTQISLYDFFLQKGD